MMETMIHVQRAHDLIAESINPLEPVSIPLSDAIGLVLAEDVFSPYDIPAYPQSSMDGYAFAFEEGKLTYVLDGEMAAGSNHPFQLEPGFAVRIFTGAAVPSGADTVLMQEKSAIQDGLLQLTDLQLKKGDNLRQAGSEIQKGAKALPEGHLLNAASIGFLAGMGISSVKVYPKPRVALLVTGNELQMPGKPLEYGQVYDSNSLTLKACLSQLHINDVEIFSCGDDLFQLQSILEKALQTADLILMTGGVSVGDYDFTMDAFESCGVKQVFHKIKQKPGKPMLFGTKNEKTVFGLPGNPASVLTCFYEYVIPAIGRMMHSPKSIESKQVPLEHDHQKPAGLTHFLKALFNGETVSLQKGQESYKLSSYAASNCLAVFPEAETTFHKGQLVDIHLLPQ
jgi:molybdopterin molybdotransferase